MYLWEVQIKMNTWTSDVRTIRVVTNTAANAVEGARIWAWKNWRRSGCPIISIKQTNEIDRVQS